MARIKYKEAVGIEVKKGRPTKSKKPSKAQLQKLYIKESRSIREIANILGCSKDIVYRSLKEHGINTRRGYKRSKLRKYRTDFIIQEIKKNGFKNTAIKLNIDVSSLRRYIYKQEE